MQNAHRFLDHSTGRRPVGGALAPVTDHRLGIWGKTWSGVFCSGMVCLVPDRKGADHITEKRCSGVDLLGCDPGSGYAALRFNMQNWLIALCGYGITLALRHQAGRLYAILHKRASWARLVTESWRCGGRQGEPMPDFQCQEEADQRELLAIGVGNARGEAPTTPPRPMTCSREARLKCPRR